MSESIDLIQERFPHPSIMRSNNEPNYYTIKEVEKKLIANAASI